VCVCVGKKTVGGVKESARRSLINDLSSGGEDVSGEEKEDEEEEMARKVSGFNQQVRKQLQGSKWEIERRMDLVITF